MQRKKKEPQRCRLCSQVVSLSQVAEHMAENHNVEEIICCFCSKVFNSTKQLRDHLSMYHPLRVKPPRSQPCQQCKECQLFITKKESFDHMEIEHKKQDECPFCSFKVGNVEYCQVTAMDLRLQCNTDLSSSGKLMKHIRLAHKMKFGCGQCKKYFHSEKILQEHQNPLLNESDRNVEVCHKPYRSGDHKKIPVPVCSICGKSTSKMIKHMAVVHDVGRKEFFKYGCSFCSAAFGFPKGLKKHLAAVHLPQNRHKCYKCEKSFSSEDRLKVHMFVHESPTLQCPQCDKFFKRKCNVVQHLRGCHYPPMYECLPCSQRFHHRASATMHLSKQHNIDNIDENLIRHKINMDADMEKIKHMKFD